MEIKKLLTLDLVDKKVLTHLSDLREIVSDEKFEVENINREVSKIQLETGEVIEQLLGFYNDTFESVHDLFVSDYQIKVNVAVEQMASDDLVNDFGVTLLKNKNVDRPIFASNIIQSISLPYWEKLSTTLFGKDIFRNVISNLETLYIKEIDKKIEAEIKKVPISVDKNLRKKYRELYLQRPISFEEFLELSKTKKMDNSSDSSFQNKSHSTSEATRRNYEAALEKKKNEELRAKQLESYDNYDAYFNMDDRKLKQAKRHGKMTRRKYTKKTRKGKDSK